MAEINNYQLTRNIEVEIGDLRVNFLGDTTFLSAKEACDTPIHIHAVHEFQYIHSGTLQEVINEKNLLTANEGELLFIPPNVMHRNAEGNCRRLVLAFTIKRIKDKGAGNNFSEYGYYCELLGKMQDAMIIRSDAIVHCIKNLMELPDLPQNGHKKILYLTMLFIRMVECIESHIEASKDALPIQQGSRADQQFFLIEQFVNTQYAKRTSIDDVAELLHLSKRQADRRVKQIFGKTYPALILDRRMSISKKMLQQSNMTCSQVAERVGYQSYTGFYVAFKGYYGCAPETTKKKS